MVATIDLAGLRALVTGGSGDLGTAIADALAAAGAHVARADVRPPAEPSACVFANCDVTDRAAVDAMVTAVGPFDVVFANAGMVDSAPFLDITPDQWQQHLDINLTGVFNTVQSTARSMVEHGIRGNIVITSSWVSDVPWPEIAAYSATKAAVSMLAKSAARELSSHGIRVNVLSPGIVKAGLAKRQLETEPQYAARVARVIPLGRTQEAREIADAALFLASPAASTMTGSTLLVDGGCSLFQFD
jgi:NAD(P)-dependent dehydrogenase (short-subunit alcohol dehydrogenase family)